MCGWAIQLKLVTGVVGVEAAKCLKSTKGGR